MSRGKTCHVVKPTLFAITTAAATGAAGARGRFLLLGPFLRASLGVWGGTTSRGGGGTSRHYLEKRTGWVTK